MRNKLNLPLILKYIDLYQLSDAFTEIEKSGIIDPIFSKLKKEFTSGIFKYDENFSDRMKTYVRGIAMNTSIEFLSTAIFESPSLVSENATSFVLRNEVRIHKMIINSWKIPQTDAPGVFSETVNRIIHWLDNFKRIEYEPALLMLEAIRFFSNNDIDYLLDKMCGELRKLFKDDFSKVIFSGLGIYSSNSGGQFLYKLRQKLRLNEAHFPIDYNNSVQYNNSIVFVDDLVGSGNQALLFYNSNLRELKVNKYYFSLLAYEKGLKYLTDNKCYNKVYSTKILSESDMAFSDVSEVFPDANIRQRISEISERYGKKLYPIGPLGYENSQALIVFAHNTPNNTLPIIWASENNEKEIGVPWNPIWERIKVSKTKKSDKQTQ